MNLKDLISILVDADKKLENNKKEVTEDAKDSQVDSVETPKEEPKKMDNVMEVDPRDKRIKELEELLAQKDTIISQNSEQINALKELTSVNAPLDNTELSIEQLIEKGEL